MAAAVCSGCSCVCHKFNEQHPLYLQLDVIRAAGASLSNDVALKLLLAHVPTDVGATSALCSALFRDSNRGKTVMQLLLFGVKQGNQDAAKILASAVAASDVAAAVMALLGDEATLKVVIDRMQNSGTPNVASECQRVIEAIIASRSSENKHIVCLLKLLCNGLQIEDGPATRMLNLIIKARPKHAQVLTFFESDAGLAGISTVLQQIRNCKSKAVVDQCASLLEELQKQHPTAGFWKKPTVLATIMHTPRTKNLFGKLVASDAAMIISTLGCSAYLPLHLCIKSITYRAHPSHEGMTAPADAVLNNLDLSTGSGATSAKPSDFDKIFSSKAQQSAGFYIEAQLPASMLIHGIVLAGGKIPGFSGGSAAKSLVGCKLEVEVDGTWQTVLASDSNERIPEGKISDESHTVIPFFGGRMGQKWRLWKESEFALSMFRFIPLQ